MTQTKSDARPSKQTTSSYLATNAVLRDCSTSGRLDLRLELQSMQILLTVLANVGRLGCAIRRITANNNVVELGLETPPQVAHRVQSCLAQIIGVQAVSTGKQTTVRRRR